MSVLPTKGNVEDVFKVLDNHNINSALMLDNKLKVLEILKPLCEVVETPIRKDRYLKINGVVVYTFKSEEEFNLLKRWSEKCH